MLKNKKNYTKSDKVKLKMMDKYKKLKIRDKLIYKICTICPLGWTDDKENKK